jgi:hypothetical protein
MMRRVLAQNETIMPQRGIDTAGGDGAPCAWNTP